MRELALERAAQVVDFFLVDEQVAVAGDAELVAADHLDAGEQLCTKACTMVDSSTKSRLRALVRQRHDARQRARRLHDGQLAVAAERILARRAAR